jgi:hypothetical protein
MTTLDFDRDRLLRQALQPGPGCPPLSELLDTLFGGATTPAAEALRVHVAGCPACAAELELASAVDAAPRSASEEQEIAWVAERATLPQSAPVAPRNSPAPQLARVLPMAAAVAARAQRAKRSDGRGEMSLWSRWAAAAMIVLGLGLAFEWGHRNFAPALPGAAEALRSDVVRSGEVLLDAPVGVATSRPSEFSWRAVDGVASYRIEVRDVAGDLLWQGAATMPRLAPPPELEAKLESFVTYRWSVTALDASGSSVAQSAPTAFRFEPAP